MRQQGFSLIEVMVAVVILAVGLLGLAAAQGRALSASSSVYYRSVAADLAMDLAERIRANKLPVLAIQSDNTLDDGMLNLLPPDFSKCVQSASNLAAAPVCGAQPGGHASFRVVQEMAEWNSLLTSQLLNGRYSLVATPVTSGAGTGGYRYLLTITWMDDRKSESGDASYRVVIE